MNVITKQNAKSDQLFTLNSLESFKAWKIEEYHRGIKQFCGVERCQAGLQSCPRRNCEALKEHPGARLDILKGFKFRSVRTFRWFTDKTKHTAKSAKSVCDPLETEIKEVTDEKIGLDVLKAAGCTV